MKNAGLGERPALKETMDCSLGGDAHLSSEPRPDQVCRFACGLVPIRYAIARFLQRGGAAMIDLNAEMDAASALATPKRIIDAGPSWEAVTAAGGIGLARVQTFKDGTYQPVDEGGRWLWLLPVFYGPPSPSTLADIVAWSGDDPSRWWRRTGNGAVLGFANVQRARASVFDFGGDVEPTPPTLHLHASPKAYALAGFSGAVVLSWSHGLGELDGVERIVCDDLAFAEHVQRELKRNRPPLPAVMVAEQVEAA